jgi:aminoglycoside 6'-N-acetyltransferase I
MNPSHEKIHGATSPTPPIFIRKMTSADIAPYCRLFQSVFSNAPWNENWPIGKIASDIHHLVRKKTFYGLVAEADSRAVGYGTGFRLGIIPSVFYMDQLFVDVEFQGNGIGNRLLAETAGIVKNLGVSIIFLLTKPNTVAERFYRGNGYKRFAPLFRINGKGAFYKLL